jgi:hypothetical protein
MEGITCPTRCRTGAFVGRLTGALVGGRTGALVGGRTGAWVGGRNRIPIFGGRGGAVVGARAVEFVGVCVAVAAPVTSVKVIRVLIGLIDFLLLLWCVVVLFVFLCLLFVSRFGFTLLHFWRGDTW